MWPKSTKKQVLGELWCSRGSQEAPESLRDSFLSLRDPSEPQIFNDFGYLFSLIFYGLLKQKFYIKTIPEQ